MAALRLSQARDPHINDRWNSRDDEEMTALLSCAKGLADISRDHLLDAALELDLEYPMQGAEFAEVAWRSGRPQDGLAILLAMLERIPDQPVYERPRAFLDSLISAIELDARSGGESLEHALLRASEAAAGLLVSGEEPADYRSRLGRQLAVRVRATALLAGVRIPEGLPPIRGDDDVDGKKSKLCCRLRTRPRG